MLTGQRLATQAVTKGKLSLVVIVHITQLRQADLPISSYLEMNCTFKYTQSTEEQKR